jgi:hypothetical protein
MSDGEVVALRVVFTVANDLPSLAPGLWKPVFARL